MAPLKQVSPITNAMSVDVEDYFQVQALESAFGRGDWDSCESRVEQNTNRLLDLFSEADIKATFFTLGWIAERHPRLVRRIADAGHEVASHGYCHARVDSQTADEFRADIRKARDILQDLSGVAVQGYRAATFSVGPQTPWAWQVLEEEGYRYSSSVYPVKRDLYGMPDAPRSPYRPAGTTDFVEVPISTVRLGGRNWPGGGGGYFRLLPYGVSRSLIQQINRADHAPAIFYLHPWEVDPDQPRPGGVSAKSRFRHYVNLERTHGRLARLSRAFRWDRMDRVFNIGGQGHAASLPQYAVA